MTATQINHLLAVETILGDDVLVLQSLDGREALSSLFRFDLTLVSENDAISLRGLLGSNASIRLTSVRFRASRRRRIRPARRSSGRA